MTTLGCGSSVFTTTMCKATCGKLFLLLGLGCLSQRARGKSFVCSVHLHESECWSLKKEDLEHVIRSERSMAR